MFVSGVCVCVGGALTSDSEVRFEKVGQDLYIACYERRASCSLGPGCSWPTMCERVPPQGFFVFGTKTLKCDRTFVPPDAVQAQEQTRDLIIHCPLLWQYMKAFLLLIPVISSRCDSILYFWYRGWIGPSSIMRISSTRNPSSKER